MKFIKPKRSLLTSFDLLFQISFSDVNEIDPYEQMKQVADVLIEGKPVLGNFNNIHDPSVAEYILAFLSGVCFTLRGNVFPISNETYLLCSEQSLKDGSMKRYLSEVEKR